MQHSDYQYLPLNKTPLGRQRWTIVLASLALTLGILLILPIASQLNRPPEPDLRLRQADTTLLQQQQPPPVQPELEQPPPPVKSEPPLPEPPAISVPRQSPAPAPDLEVELSLNITDAQSPRDTHLKFAFADTVTSAEYSDAPNFSSSAKTVFELNELDNQPQPIAQPAPLYPFNARRRGLEGFVNVSFTVTRRGTVENVRVINADPPDVFEAAALNAVRKWRFSPAEKGGEPVAVNLQQRIVFELDQ